MGYTLVTCASCGQPNSPGIALCMNCGETLDAAARDAAFRESDNGEADGIPPARPLAEDQLRDIAATLGYTCKSTASGLAINAKLEDGRRQTVHVFMNGRDTAGRDLIGFVSLCGSAEETQALRLLKLNARLPFGSIVWRDIAGQPHIVMQANQLAETADRAELQTLLVEIARQADWLERQLGKGDDRY